MKAILLIMLALAMAGCGDTKPTAYDRVFDEQSGHASTWVDPARLGTAGFHGENISVTFDAPSGGGLYTVRCSGCHGATALGDVGPNIRNKTQGQVTTALSSVAYMSSWLPLILSTEDTQNIVTFLANTNATTNYTVDAGLCLECHGDDLLGGISGRSCTACHNGPAGKVGHPSGWYTEAGGGMHPSYGGKYRDACIICHTGGRIASCTDCHDGGGD